LILNIDVKRLVRENCNGEIKDETAYKRKIKIIIKEVVQEEMINIKQELEDLRKIIQGKTGGPARVKKSYSEAVKEKKKENIIIVKSKVQQESETTKKLIKEKVDIKSMDMDTTKLRKGNKGTVIMERETEEEMKKLKNNTGHTG